MSNLQCFKAYDIRGDVPDEIDDSLACNLGMAIAKKLAASRAVIGHDARLSGENLSSALALGLGSGGCRVSDLGLCCTEEIYHAAANGNFDAGIMITGSHNPANQNGFKIVRKGAIPVSGDTGLNDLRDFVAEKMQKPFPSMEYKAESAKFRPEYVSWLLAYTGFNEPVKIRPLKIVVDSGNGCAGLLLEQLAGRLPFEFVHVRSFPDGTFPQGVPNPLLPENRDVTARAVRENGADLGIAWDGDADRCFFYDEHGNFLEGYYLVGLLASELLRRFPGGRIIHDPRAYWNTREMVLAAGGIPVMGKTGHAFMKERMRSENAIYGGEMSAHHYFRDFAYCDSGMLPWLLVVSMLARGGGSLAQMMSDRMSAWPCSGEINRRIANPAKVLVEIEKKYAPNASICEKLDGLNMEFGNWRFNLRMSNTEPLLRLNVESRADRALMEDRTEELLATIDSLA